MNSHKFLINFIKPILSLLLCLSFLPNDGFALLDSDSEWQQLETITSACDFEAKLLIERSPKCGDLGGVVSVWVTENDAPVTYFWKADGGEMFSTGTVNTLENVPADVTHWAIIRDASGCEIMLDFELAEQPCICPLTARAIINKFPECGKANGSVRIDYAGDQGEVTFDSDWGQSARRDDLGAGPQSVTLTDEMGCKFVLEFELTEGTCCQNYEATAVINKLPDCGEANGSVSINVVGQNGEVTYSWGEGNRMDNLAGGEYWVIVKDEKGCSVTVYFKLAGANCCVDTDLAATAVIHQQPECGQNNGSAEIVATGGVAPYTYSWGEKSRFDNLNPGNYRVTVTDAFDCTAEVIFELTREDCCKETDLTAVATINRQPECGKTNGSVTINASGGVAPYNYSWGSLSSYDNLIPGNYFVTVTDAFGCAMVVNFILIQEDCCKDSDLAVTPIINKHPECGQSNGSVNLVVTGGVAPYAYSWGGQASFDNLIPGKYSVTVTDAFDCSAVVDFELIEGPCCSDFAVELMIQDPSNCDQNDGVVNFINVGTTGNLTYTWDDGIITSDSFRTNLSNRTYQVTVTDDVLACQHIIRLPLKTFAPCPPLDTCFTTEINILKQPDCEQSNGSVELKVTGDTNALRYTWSDGVVTTTGIRNDLIEATYEVIVEEEGTMCKDTVNFTLVSPAPCPIPPDTCFTSEVIILKQPDCEQFNGSVELKVTGNMNALKYTWSDGVVTTTGIRNDLVEATYEVIIEEEGTMCQDTVNFTLVSPAPCPIPPDTCFTSEVIILKQPDCEQSNGSVELKVRGNMNALKYTWSDGVVTTTGIRNDLIEATYEVIIEEEGTMCQDTVNFTLVSPAPCPIPPDTCFTSEVIILKQPDCEQSNGSVELKVTGNMNALKYTWSDGVVTTTGIRNDLVEATYEVIIEEEGTMCKDTVNFILISPDPCPPCFTAVVNILKQPDCEDTTGTVEIMVTGAEETLTYIWPNDVLTTNFRDGLPVGSYQVIIVEAETMCRDTVDFTLVSPEPCPIVCFTADVNIIKQPDCDVANGTVAISTTGANNSLQYIWEDTILSDSVRTDLIAKDYQVIIKEDSTDCMDTIMFTLENPMPPILILSPDTLCSDTAIGGLRYDITGCFALPVNIQILDTAGIVVAAIENDTLGKGRIEALLPNQNYTFVAVDDNGQEIDPQTFMVIIPPKIDYQLFRDTILCDGTAMTEIGILVSDSTAFSWLPHPNIADSLLTATSLEVPIGSYAITLNNGCPTVDSVVVQDGSISIDKLEPDPLCRPGTTTLNIINLKPMQELSYVWTPNTTITSPTDTTDSPVVNVTETTEYTVAISNQFGCELVDYMTVIVADTTLLAAIRILPNQEKIPATGTSELSLSEPLPDGFIFEWQEATTLEDRGETAIVSPTINGTSYFVTIFNEIAPQCFVTRDTAIWIGCDEDALFMPNAFSPNGDGINDVLYVRGADGFLSMNLIIYNRWGEKVFETSDADFGWDGRFEGEELGPDVYGYYLTVTCPSGVITRQGNITLLK